MSTSEPLDVETTQVLVHWVTLLLLHASLCLCVSTYMRCYVVTAIGSWRFLILLYIKLTLTVPASFPSVPNDHPHLCVCACMWSSVLKYECLPHTLCVILPHTHAHIHTHTRVYDGKHLQLLWSLWWRLLNALVLWGLTGVWELTKTCHWPTHFEAQFFVFSLLLSVGNNGSGGHFVDTEWVKVFVFL